MPKNVVRRVVASEESIVHATLDLANHLIRGGERLAAAAGLTTQQWIVLLQIAGDPNFPGAPRRKPRGVLPSEIAAARGVSRATVSVVVSALTARGLIEQVSDDGDLRRRRLVPTAAGHALLASLEPQRRAANRRLLAPLSSSERTTLLSLLRRCLGSIQELSRDRAAGEDEV